MMLRNTINVCDCDKSKDFSIKIFTFITTANVHGIATHDVRVKCQRRAADSFRGRQEGGHYVVHLLEAVQKKSRETEAA